MSLVDMNDERQAWLWERTFTGNEFATTEFWAYMFKEKIFNGPDYSIAPEAPPTGDNSDRRRVDQVIKKWEPGEHGKKGKFAALLFFEAKKHEATQTEIDTLEKQVYTASIAWLIANGAHEAYSMSAVGEAARIWYTTSNADYLLPMVPRGPELSERSSYIRASSSSGYELLNAFATIVRYPRGLPQSEIKVLKSNSTPPGTAADLAQGFDYDHEMPYDAIEDSGAGASYNDGGTTEEATKDYSYAETSGDHLASTSGSYPTHDDDTPFPQMVPELPMDAEQVVVKYRIDDAGEYIYRFDDSFGSRRDVKASEWESRTKLYNGEALRCFLNTRSNGKKYWTWTLDPTMLTRYERKGKGRE